MKKPLILVTNDDGDFAPGIRALVESVQNFGEVVLVAPDRPQSGQGHAITISKPLRLTPIDSFPGIEAYKCNGTPVDCVKLALEVPLKDREVALCVSGINHGSNASINIIYSGTMSAAMEASIRGINSIGFSLLDFEQNADFAASKLYVQQIVAYVLKNGIINSNLLNVNIPKLPVEEIKGIRVCRQADARWDESFVKGKDPRGKNYYWLAGHFEQSDLNPDTDLWALNNGYISVVPSGHDLTKYDAIDPLKAMQDIK